MKRILFATSEAVPFIKTGGLADVAGSLPKCFDKRYFDIRVILPKYGRDTFLFAFGIAAGMSIAWAICYFLRSVKAR